MKVFVCHSGAPRNPRRIPAAHQRGTFTQPGPVDQTNAGLNAPHQQLIRYQMSRVLAGCNASAAISPHSTSAQR
jgi:hypothetical protein